MRRTARHGDAIGDEAQRAQLLGDDVPAIAARDEPGWQAWFGEQFAVRRPPASARPSAR